MASSQLNFTFMSYMQHLLHGMICAMVAFPIYATQNKARVTHTQQQHQKIVLELETGKVIKKEPMDRVLDRQGKKYFSSASVLGNTR
ncbi:MAG: hypothetical protein V3581_02050 [Candidatus Cardinium sp.]|uniref:hypothetical protein n=1 Tax=Candidatus Cardinium sp. TP TaxID=2961955 RepID=UPI0021B074FD|nr:hypothetical protein [Candidatus Cardinium sp. TP]MCT4697019.1 hypothetical protein [Candidatus Cardinium sp. TP]MDN5246925.1 hypothetical protein [Candidatus Cardinium sp.]